MTLEDVKILDFLVTLLGECAKQQAKLLFLELGLAELGLCSLY